MLREEYIQYVENIYQATRKLIMLTPEEKFNFKPMEGVFTIDQLLHHCSGCLGGMAYQAYHDAFPDIPPENMLPPAETYLRVSSVNEAVEKIDKDFQLMKDEFGKMTEDEFNTKMIKPPWMPFEIPFAAFMMQAFEHLSNHRMQLFLWLRLSEEKINTAHLYGMI